MVLLVLCKLVLQTRMYSHPVGLDIWFLIRSFVYFHASCMRTAKALARPFAGRLCDEYHELAQLDRVKRIWYLSPMRAAKVQASLRIRPVSPEPPLLAHISSESRGTFRQKATSLASLNGWACAVKTCRDRMLEDTNSLDRAQLMVVWCKLKIPSLGIVFCLYYTSIYYIRILICKGNSKWSN